jgi:hypothetical protein
MENNLLSNAALAYYSDHLRNVEKICPVTLEHFSSSNPPYKLNNCFHRLSREALKGLTIYRVNKYNGAVYHLCPICKKKIHFASLDEDYLFLINLAQDFDIILQAINLSPTITGDIKSTMDEFKEKCKVKDDFPIMMQPKDGILTLLNVLFRCGNNS